MEQLEADGDTLRREIVHLQYDLEEQETRIRDLNQLVDNVCYL